MNIISYGGGTNSTALLIECVKRKIPIDLILFADTGGEKPNTYKYIRLFNKWLKNKKYPQITVVQTQDINGTYITLEHRCLITNSLPSKAYGFSSCSEKHKIRPQNKYINNWEPAKKVWNNNEKINKFIGFDSDEPHRNKDYTDKKYIFSAPLIEWNMGRDECIKTIIEAGLPLPGKSSCFYCPHTKKDEIIELAKTYPDLITRALKMESNAELTTIKGLGRRFNWAEFLAGKTVDNTEIDICDTCYDGVGEAD